MRSPGCRGTCGVRVPEALGKCHNVMPKTETVNRVSSPGRRGVTRLVQWEKVCGCGAVKGLSQELGDQSFRRICSLKPQENVHQ